MSVTDLLLGALNEVEAVRSARVPFLVKLLSENAAEVRVQVEMVATAATAKGSAVGRLYAKIAELSQSSSVSERMDAATVLHACMNAGCCCGAALEAFSKPWVTAITACLGQRNPGVIKALGCKCFVHIIRGIHVLGRDTHCGREVMAALQGQLTSLLRVLDGSGDAQDSPSTAACLEAIAALLTYTPQTLRSQAPRITAKCILLLDHADAALSQLAHTVLALLCTQVCSVCMQVGFAACLRPGQPWCVPCLAAARFAAVIHVRHPTGEQYQLASGAGRAPCCTRRHFPGGRLWR